MLPATLITLLFMQYISLCLSLPWAYSFPTVSTVGNAGGTTIVIISNAFTAISPGVTPLDD